MTDSNQILVNGIRTPDGTEIFSRHRHDYVSHTDKNGKHYAVDGGADYLRRVGELGDYEDISVYYDPDDHESNAKNARWGTFGKYGNGPLRWVTVREMETDHIEAVLEQTVLRPILKTIMQKELAIRGPNTQKNDAA